MAGAARPDSAAKRAYFTRYFTDRALNEEWVTASLGAFVAPGHEALAHEVQCQPGKQVACERTRRRPAAACERRKA